MEFVNAFLKEEGKDEPSSAKDTKKVYMTMLCNDSYFNGVSVLVKSLKKHCSGKFPIAVMCDSNVSKATMIRLHKMVDIVITVDVLKEKKCDKLACPVCGYLTNNDIAYGGFEICPLCDWEDDALQMCNPASCGGANAESLIQLQKIFAESVKGLDDNNSKFKGYEKDPTWRRFTTEEINLAERDTAENAFKNKCNNNPEDVYWKRHTTNAPWFASNMTKLRLWEQDQFDMIMYIDADCMVLDDIDEIFHTCKNVDFAAAPDIFPPDKFNAGVMFIKPNKKIFHKLCEKLGKLLSYDGGDTGYLNEFYPDWYENDTTNTGTLGLSLRLPFSYNMQRTLYWFTHEKRPGYWDSIKNKKIVHFSSSPKPWEATMQTVRGDLELKWWSLLMGIDTDIVNT
jgi:alpha-N-acetylglucosamine transferase